MAFASLTDLADRMGQMPADSVRAEVMLEEATDLIRAITGQDILQASNAVTLIGTGRRRLQLPQVPVTAVAVVVEGATWPTSDYSWGADGTLVREYGSWCGPVVVTYTHGYAVVPGDIKRLTAYIATELYEERVAIRSESVGSYSVTYLRSASGDVTSMTDDSLAILRRYTLPLLP